MVWTLFDGRSVTRSRAAWFLAVLLVALSVLGGASAASAETTPYYTTFTAGDGRVLRLLVWPGPNEQSPVVFAIHGGGFTRGTMEGSTPICEHLVATLPVACISPEYRLDSRAPRVLREALDVAQAVAHVRENAGAFGIDPDRIALQGSSAGGTLALLADSFFGVQARAVVDALGPTDFIRLQTDTVDYTFGAEKVVFNAVGCVDDSDLCRTRKRNHSPLLWAGRNSAPTLIMHAPAEMIDEEQGRRLASRLTSLGVTNEFMIVDGASHAIFPLEYMDDWFRTHLFA